MEFGNYRNNLREERERALAKSYNESQDGEHLTIRIDYNRSDRDVSTGWDKFCHSAVMFFLACPSLLWTPLMILFLIIFLIRYHIHRKWQILRKMNIPHDPPTLSKIGNLVDALSPKSAYEYDNICKAKYGKVWGLYSFTSPSITIHDPDMIRQIFITEFRNFTERQGRLVKINGRELNTAVSFARGNKWKRIRTTLSPTFSKSKLMKMTPIIETCTDNTLKACINIAETGDGTFNSKGLFSRLSLDVICSTAFSANVNSQDHSKTEPEICKQAKNLFSGNFLNPLFILCAIFPKFESLIGKLEIPIFGKGSLKYFKTLTELLIARRKEDKILKDQRVDLMQLMMDAEISDEQARSEIEKGLTRTEIIGNAIIMIIAGYENTGNSMSFLAYNFAFYQEAQAKAQMEIDEYLKEGGELNYHGVKRLKYLEMCINESLRLYNPIIRNARICNKETVINGVQIPKGIQVNIPTFALSHDTEYWVKPYEFIPERMSDMTKIDPMVYQPFGGGPRNCIGMRFALLEMKLAMAKILQHFSFAPATDTPTPPLELKFAVSTRSAIDYNLRVIRRH